MVVVVVEMVVVGSVSATVVGVVGSVSPTVVGVVEVVGSVSANVVGVVGSVSPTVVGVVDVVSSEHFINLLGQVSSPSNVRHNVPMEPSALTLMHGPLPTPHKSSLQNASGSIVVVVVVVTSRQSMSVFLQLPLSGSAW